MTDYWPSHSHDLLPGTPPIGNGSSTSLAISGWASIEKIHSGASDCPTLPALQVSLRLIGGHRSQGFTQLLIDRATPGAQQACLMTQALWGITEQGNFMPYRLMAQVCIVGVEMLHTQALVPNRYHGMIESIRHVFLDERRVFVSLDVIEPGDVAALAMPTHRVAPHDDVPPWDIQLMLEKQGDTVR